MGRIFKLRDLLDLKGDLAVLWARPRGEEIPFEVSREVTVILEDRCPSSPFCPGERIPRIRGSPGPGEAAWAWADVPDFTVNPEDCPLGFESKGECYRRINIIAFRKGALPRKDLLETARYFSVLGYTVFAEMIWEKDLDGHRILLSHGPLYNFHEFRVELGPGGQRYFLVRNPYEDEMPETAREIFP